MGIWAYGFGVLGEYVGGSPAGVPCEGPYSRQNPISVSLQGELTFGTPKAGVTQGIPKIRDTFLWGVLTIRIMGSI